MNNGEESQERRCTCECAPYFFFVIAQLDKYFDELVDYHSVVRFIALETTLCFFLVMFMICAVLRTAAFRCE